jgi:hypothetical protein
VLFGDDITDDIPRRITCLPVKKCGLAIPNPTETADTNWTASMVIWGHLISAIRGMEVFSSTEHASIMNAGKAETVARYLSESKAKLSGELEKISGRRSRTIQRGEQTRAWLLVLPSTINGTELSAQEFRDAIHMRHGITPPNLPETCDGCDARFSLQHALLGCKKGGFSFLSVARFLNLSTLQQLKNSSMLGYHDSAPFSSEFLPARGSANGLTIPVMLMLLKGEEHLKPEIPTTPLGFPASLKTKQWWIHLTSFSPARMRRKFPSG